MRRIALTLILGFAVIDVTTVVAALLIAVAPSVHAQSTRPQFEVASVKPSGPGRTVDNGGLALRFTPGRLSATNSSLMELIEAAYRLPHW
jgi:hypothetical protein